MKLKKEKQKFQFKKKNSINNSEINFQKFCSTKAVAGVLTIALILES